MTGGKVQISPRDAWHHGTNIQSAYKHDAITTRTFLVTALGRLVQDVDANKTLRTDEELKFTCRAIMEEHPTLKLEEIAIAFDYIRMGKFGKLYERLKTAEILEALSRYEGEIRVQIMETQMHNDQVEYKKPLPEEMTNGLREYLNNLDIKELPKGEGIGTRLRKQLDKLSPLKEEDK